jgi:hypothetical protein
MWTITLHKKNGLYVENIVLETLPMYGKNAWLQFKIHYNIAHKNKNNNIDTLNIIMELSYDCYVIERQNDYLAYKNRLNK